MNNADEQYMSRSAIRRWTRPLRHYALTFALKTLSGVARRAPLAWCQRAGEMLGWCVWRVTHHTQTRTPDIIARQLNMTREALGLDASARVRVRRAHWIDLGRRVGEWLAGPRALHLFWVSPESEATLKQAYRDASPCGLIVMTAHYGHWELMAAWLSARGFDFLAIASLPPRGPFGEWLSDRRARFGVRVIHPRGGARHAYRHLKRGGVVALLIDHATVGHTYSAPFLGIDAPHSTVADRLHHRSGAEALWVCSQRGADGRYEIKASLLTRDSSVEVTCPSSPLTQRAHGQLTELICADPAQWLWLHRRWTPRSLHPSGMRV